MLIVHSNADISQACLQSAVNILIFLISYDEFVFLFCIKKVEIVLLLPAAFSNRLGRGGVDLCHFFFLLLTCRENIGLSSISSGISRTVGMHFMQFCHLHQFPQCLCFSQITFAIIEASNRNPHCTSGVHIPLYFQSCGFMTSCPRRVDRLCFGILGVCLHVCHHGSRQDRRDCLRLPWLHSDPLLAQGKGECPLPGPPNGDL